MSIDEKVKQSNLSIFLEYLVVVFTFILFIEYIDVSQSTDINSFFRIKNYLFLIQKDVNNQNVGS